jgi:putative tryptophan/tyrosine transport system substrate-binding protein
MNHRRELLLALLGTPVGLARAQAVKPGARLMRAGILRTTGPDRSLLLFVETMRELGWAESRDIVYDGVHAEGDETRLPALAAALVARKPDVIFVQNNAGLRAVLASTRTIPIVFASVSLPVENGFIKSLRQPGGNVTGVASIGNELGGRRMQLLRRVMPDARRVAVLYSPLHPSSRNERMLIEQAAGTGVHLTWLIVNEAEDLQAGLAKAAGRIEALLITQIPLFSRERKRILGFAAAHRIPVIAATEGFVEDGALLAYTTSFAEHTRRSAHLVDKILRGANPADIPVEQPTTFELTLNLKTAKALGITIPHAVRVQASRVIE